MTYPILDQIKSPDDLTDLSDKEISALAAEIREFLIKSAGEHGGHLASNLGVVELTLAIHSVFDSPHDHIIFDVGHQAYVHKIITGRGDFSNLRIPGGLSGFTLRRESAHDPFGAGHSSTSVSASLGFAEADALKGSDAYTVCVIGDGAYTGGMVHEALNNCRPDLPLIIVLNENGMSISLNKGTFAAYLSRVRVSRGYRRWKAGTNTFLSHIPLIGRLMQKLFSLIKAGIKKLVYRNNYFEELGLYYIGPVDGNDYKKVKEALERAKQLGKTAVVHVKTVKGKGYEPAEKSPDGYHSVASSGAKSTYHSEFASELIRCAENDDRIVAVTAAMGIGTGLDSFGAVYPDRYFDVGIAEEHALTFSAGLAANGLSPFVAIYSTFLQRGYDSILHDIALQGLPVRIMIDRAGLSLGDGATHHGIFDVAFLSHIPNMILLAPANYDTLRSAIGYAAASESPIAIRYPNSGECAEISDSFKPLKEDPYSPVWTDFAIGDTPKYIFVTYGKIVEKVIAAKKLLGDKGVDVGIILVTTIKPYAPMVDAIRSLARNSARILFVEEGIRNGGAGEICQSELYRAGFDFSATDYDIAAIDDNFAIPESVCDLYDYVGLSPEKLAEKMLNQ